MTKAEWLKDKGIHVCKPNFDMNSEADAEWIAEWDMIFDVIDGAKGEEKNARLHRGNDKAD